MREAVWTACVAAAYALGFLSALLCLELSHEWDVQGSSSGVGDTAGLYGRPLRTLARQITLRSLFPDSRECALCSFASSSLSGLQ